MKDQPISKPLFFKESNTLLLEVILQVLRQHSDRKQKLIGTLSKSILEDCFSIVSHGFQGKNHLFWAAKIINWNRSCDQ